MDKYLTTKVAPERTVVLVEIIVVLVTSAVLLLLLAAVIAVCVQSGIESVNVRRVLLLAMPSVIVLYLVMRRWYDRTQAKQIVSLLCASEQGCMTCGEMSKAGVFAPAKSIANLTRHQYIRGVVEMHGIACLAECGLQQSNEKNMEMD